MIVCSLCNSSPIVTNKSIPSGWEKIDNKFICPVCIRDNKNLSDKDKIKMLINISNDLYINMLSSIEMLIMVGSMGYIDKKTREKTLSYSKKCIDLSEKYNDIILNKLV